MQQETKLYLRDVGLVQQAKAELRRADQCERLLPQREEEKGE